MALRWVRYLCFTLLAMVFPSQVFAYLAQSETDNRSPVIRDASTPFKPSLFKPALFTTTKSQSATHRHSDHGSEPTSTPSSQTHAGAEKGMVNTPRWLWNIRHATDDVSSFDDTGTAAVVLSTHRRFIVIPLSSAYRLPPRYFQPHRLAGWKETNALYVALNSQF